MTMLIDLEKCLVFEPESKKGKHSSSVDRVLVVFYFIMDYTSLCSKAKLYVFAVLKHVQLYLGI